MAQRVWPDARIDCTITPTPRPDGLVELRGRPGEVTGAPCTAGDLDDALAWVAAGPDRMLIAPPGAYALATAVSTDAADGTRILTLRSTTTDLRCLGPGEAPGIVGIDLIDQTRIAWIETPATDAPVHVVTQYARGGCSFVRDGNDVIVTIDGAAAQHDEVATEGAVHLEGAALVVVVPYGSQGGCTGTAPGPDDPQPAEQSIGPGYLLSRVRVRAPGAFEHVVVRQNPYVEPECS